MSVQELPSADVWILYALPYAASHCRTTDVIVEVAPRSTRNHCGSDHWLAQREPASPSVAKDAARPAPSSDDAVVGLPCDSSVSAACAANCTTTTYATTTDRTMRGMRYRHAVRGGEEAVITGTPGG